MKGVPLQVCPLSRAYYPPPTPPPPPTLTTPPPTPENVVK